MKDYLALNPMRTDSSGGEAAGVCRRREPSVRRRRPAKPAGGGWSDAQGCSEDLVSAANEHPSVRGRSPSLLPMWCSLPEAIPLWVQQLRISLSVRSSSSPHEARTMAEYALTENARLESSEIPTGNAQEMNTRESVEMDSWSFEQG